MRTLLISMVIVLILSILSSGKEDREQPGTYVLVFQTRKGKQQPNTFETPVDIGASSGSYFKGRREEETTRDLVLLNDRDVASDYVVHWGGPKVPFPPARARGVVIGTAEKESFELGMVALKDLGRVTLSVQSTPQLPGESLRLRTMRGRFQQRSPPGVEGLRTSGRRRTRDAGRGAQGLLADP